MTCRQPSSSNSRRLTACLITVLLAVFLAHASSMARAGDQPLPKLATAANWHVAPIVRPPSVDDDRVYCSAKAGFSNNITFVVARDSGGGQSLAFEHVDKPFAAGATIPVIMNAGEAQVQTQALAATTRVLLISLARGGALETAMQRNGTFELTALKKRRIFSLAGFAQAIKTLDQCVVAGVNKSVFEPVKIDAETAQDHFKTAQAIREKDVQRFSNVTPEEVQSFNPAVAARAAVLEDEVERLRRQNAELQMHRQQIETELLLSQGLAVPSQAGTATSLAPVIVRSSKQVSWPQGAGFADVVATYLTTEAARCPADFAHTLGRTHQLGQVPVQEAEFACLGSATTEGGMNTDYAAALVFIGRAGQMQVILFQGPAGMIEQALRDRAQTLATMGIAPTQ